jgi:Flp pilus assembly protein TadD
MEYYPFILLFLALIVLIIRPFTILFHELGHAILAILMTKQSVSIYIGSYGDPKNSFHIKVGLLHIWFKYNLFSWQSGICVPSAKQIPINKQIAYTLAGPLTSFLIAIFACYFTFIYDLHGFFKFIFTVFFASSIIDLFVNLIPNSTPIILYDSTIIYNDGYHLKQLFYYKKFPKEYEIAFSLYSKEKFAESAIAFHKILKNGLKNNDIYRFTILSYIQSKNYKTAIELSEKFIMLDKLNSDDYAFIGISFSELNIHDKALEYYNKSLALNSDNVLALNNKGYELNLLNKYEEAIPLFNKAIEIDNTFVYSYNNRGLAKIKTGKSEEGLDDIYYSLKLYENNSYAYRNLGIYHFDNKNYSKALEFFIKSKELDKTTHMIDELINQSNMHIKK